MAKPLRRGSYAKGIAKREEILERALEVIARDGYSGASVKTLAEEVNLSQAGLLHYFGTKDDLFVEVLRKRDEVDSLRFGEVEAAATTADFDAVRAGYLETITHNCQVPGLVELFTRLSAEAADPDHPAHAFFVQRQARILDLFTTVLEAGQRNGQVTDSIPAATMARLLQATADGLQQQWLLDPDVDMAATIETVFALLRP